MPGTMKRGREEGEKSMEPLFPRLHVNDVVDTMGPRAPPRNKMALYEQLSIPSQRFNGAGGAGSEMGRIQQSIAGTTGASSSSSQAYGHERNYFSPFYVSPHTPARLAERFRFHSSDETNLNATSMDFERSINHVNNRTLNPTGLIPTFTLPRSRDDSRAEKSSCKKIEDQDDFMVPAYYQYLVTAYLSKGTATTEPERLTPFYTESPQKSCSNDKSPGQISTSVLKYNLNHSKEKPKEAAIFKGPQEKSCNDALGGPRFLNGIEVGNSDTLRVRNESCPQASLGDNDDKANAFDEANGQSDDKANKSFKMGDRDKTDEASESSLVESIQGINICPDDLVGVIGSEHFWKARKAIVNQQRIFSLQLFELHRLIKVQKLIASSPDLLREGNPYVNSSPKALTQSLSPEHMVTSDLESDLETAKLKGEPQQPNQKESTVGAMPLPSHEEEGLCKGIVFQGPRNEAYSGNQSASPWYFQPHPNQWLVPVMSPSEGLVYKPYTGSCPPTSGFVAPIYGNCAPLSLPHQQQNMGVLSGAPNYFLANPIMPASAVEQVSPLARSLPHGHAEQHSRSSCNMSSQKSEAFSGHSRKFQACKDSELQGSTASSPCGKAQEGRDALPLFPIDRTVEGSTHTSPSCGRDNQARAIKVVPHNATSATESVARIFRCIQEERQQCDS